MQAASGKECLEKIKQEHYDLIFLDHMMPELDGIQTYELMCKDHQHLCQDTPVIMLTANVTAGAKERYLAAGFCDFLPKPILYDTLEKLLLAHLPEEYIEQRENVQKDKTVHTVEDLPQIEEFDLDYAMLIWKSKTRLRTGLQEFAYELVDMQQKLTTLFAEEWTDENQEAYRCCIHTLKGTSATVGALLLSKTARLQEMALSVNNREQIQVLHTILIAQIKAHRQRLQTCFPKEDHPKLVTETKQNLLEMLQSALDNEDLQSLDYIYQQLAACSWNEQEEEVVKSLQQDLRELAWESARNKVEMLQSFC